MSKLKLKATPRGGPRAASSLDGQLVPKVAEATRPQTTSGVVHDGVGRQDGLVAAGEDGGDVANATAVGVGDGTDGEEPMDALDLGEAEIEAVPGGDEGVAPGGDEGGGGEGSDNEDGELGGEVEGRMASEEARELLPWLERKKGYSLVFDQRKLEHYEHYAHIFEAATSLFENGSKKSGEEGDDY